MKYDFFFINNGNEKLVIEIFNLIGAFGGKKI